MLQQTIAGDRQACSASIPRPEYPRPDWRRKDWLNLNGTWDFHLEGEAFANPASASLDFLAFGEKIEVPFSWASPLSGIGRNEKGAAWYRRRIEWKPQTESARIFLRFGAVDYLCDVWVNGTPVGKHQGGYGSFEFEVTGVWRTNAPNTILVRAEDLDDNAQTRGKQGYGEIRGIWQTVWLEARPTAYLQGADFRTHLDGLVEASGRIHSLEAGSFRLSFAFAGETVRHELDLDVPAGESEWKAAFRVADPRLWAPDSPYLYEGEIKLSGRGGTDEVAAYFGIREIGSARFGERGYRWITLNGKPIYLNGTLDQSFNAEGYFTYPTDEAMREEIYLMKRLGLTFVRIHIKPEEPRKLYWADKLGLLVMEDMPCFWGTPDERTRAAYEREAAEIIERDRNHPSIFSWVMFNETWGLKTDGAPGGLTGDVGHAGGYLPETQEWVRGRYRWAKETDPTRLVEDHSPCNHDHVESDLNTWHFYINGYEALRSHVQSIADQTYPGSTFNYIGGNAQTDAPLMNSECGNVWGIEGGAGDSDIAWHYRYMLNEFRRHDKLCGFVFTEFRDVVNEFNGYYRLDGTDKHFGYEGLVPDMTIADLHSPDFLAIDSPPCQTVKGGEEVVLPLLRSSFSDRYHGKPMKLAWELAYDNLGTRVVAMQGSREISWDGYGVAALEPVSVRMPEQDAVAVLAVRLIGPDGETVTRNFAAFDVTSGLPQGSYFEGPGAFVSVPVGGYVASSFPYTWESIQGGKVSGGAAGSLVYEVELPAKQDLGLIGQVELYFEASAKRLLERHTEGALRREAGIDYMHGANAETERNPNTSYMTDDREWSSRLRVLVDGEEAGVCLLPDDPADSRGVLSWHYQPTERLLDDAGSYGYLCKVVVPGRLAAKLDIKRKLRLELAADEGGLSLYGRKAGRYPIDLLVRCR